jgi:hypothetical protein
MELPVFTLPGRIDELPFNNFLDGDPGAPGAGQSFRGPDRHLHNDTVRVELPPGTHYPENVVAAVDVIHPIPTHILAFLAGPAPSCVSAFGHDRLLLLCWVRPRSCGRIRAKLLASHQPVEGGSPDGRFPNGSNRRAYARMAERFL